MRDLNMRHKRILCALILVIIQIGLATILNPAKGLTDARLYVDPPKVEGITYLPPQTFNVNILVANIDGLNTLRFNMSFSPAILAILGVSTGALDHSPSPSWQINGPIGLLWFEVIFDVPISTASSITVATVTFLIKGHGATPIDLHDTSMSNPNAQPISHIVEDGYFRNFDLYDLNFDGKVDLDDLTIVALAFGSYPGHPRWNPIADVNKDGKVDIDDIILVAGHFGKGI